MMSRTIAPLADRLAVTPRRQREFRKKFRTVLASRFQFNSLAYPIKRRLVLMFFDNIFGAAMP